MEKKRFLMAFQISKMVIFEVEYGAIKENKEWYFATSAARFVRNKQDYSECGQCQQRVLTGAVYGFWKKWDKHHLMSLTDEQYTELMQDINTLKDNYNYIEKGEDYTNHFIWFSELKRLSMMKVKKGV